MKAGLQVPTFWRGLFAIGTHHMVLTLLACMSSISEQ